MLPTPTRHKILMALEEHWSFHCALGPALTADRRLVSACIAALCGQGDVCIGGKAVEGLLKHDIVCIATGAYHTMAVTAERLVFVWGDNRNGQLGIDSVKEIKIGDESAKTWMPVMVPYQVISVISSQVVVVVVVVVKFRSFFLWYPNQAGRKARPCSPGTSRARFCLCHDHLGNVADYEQLGGASWI